MPRVARNSKMGRTARRIAASDPLIGPLVSKHFGEEPIQQPATQASAHDDNIDDDIGVLKSQQLSRGQRKRLARRETFLRKEKMILSSLKIKNDEEQKSRIDGLDAIKESLLGTKSIGGNKGAIMHKKQIHESTNQTLVTTNKAKKKIVAGEIEHLGLILQHPSYKKDPFATMQEHLQNTLADERKQQEEHSKQRFQQEKEKRDGRQRLKKEVGAMRKKSKKKYKPRRTN